MTVDKKRPGGGVEWLPSVQGGIREGPGDGTGKSRHCTAYCVLYASPVLHGETYGVRSCRPGRPRYAQSILNHTDKGGQRSEWLAGRPQRLPGFLGSQLLRRAPTCHRARRVHPDFLGGGG